MVQLMTTCLLQAAEYHNFGYFTSALAVNLLDRFMAAQPTSVSLKTLHPANAVFCCLLSSIALAGHLMGAWKGVGLANMHFTNTALNSLIEL